MVMAPARDLKARLESVSRQAIQDAVVRILSRQGPERLTMEKVAAEAGIAKGTVYRFFRNKEHLLHSVRELAFAPLDSELSAVFDGPFPAAEKIRRLIVGYVVFLEKHRELFRVLLWDRRLAAARRERGPRARYRVYVERLASVISSGIRSGEFRDLPPAKVAEWMVESTFAVVSGRLWNRESALDPPEQDASLLIEMILHGIGRHSSARRRNT
jgi:AcrR family transcriptional regulator